MNLLSTGAVAAILFAPLVTAQSPFTTLTQQSIGNGCNVPSTGCCAIVAAIPTFLATLDLANAELDIVVPAIEGCCGVTVPVRVLVLGFQQTLVPLPELGLGCELHVDAAAALVMPAATISLPLPPTLSPLTLLAQAGYLSVWPQGNQSTFAISDARALSLQ